MRQTILLTLPLLLGGCAAAPTLDPSSGVGDLARLTPGRTAAQNALWVENAADKRFENTRRVVVADIAGPATIAMIHFALPQNSIEPEKKYILGRDLLIRMYWDGETTPSVDCPLVDFFCDPAGLRESVNTALLNKRRGFNAYFPMPFRKSARIELIYDGPVEPGKQLWSMMPCYSYVMYRQLGAFPTDTGYFHACWRRELLPLGKQDYLALDAKGDGKFVGWNVTVRLPGRQGYPVDENEKFYVDGEAEPSIEFQGLEDSFGFSWGYPPAENLFPLTGYFPFEKDGATAYRFFINDAIRFRRSLRVAIGFGREERSFQKQFSKEGSELEFSTVCYWYQTEPHAPLPPIPPPKERPPVTWNVMDYEKLPSADELRARGVHLEIRCGRPQKEVTFAEPGYSAEVKNGYAYADWPGRVFHCRADNDHVDIELTVPKGKAGTVRLYVIDPDQFMGGRKQEITVAGRSLGVVENFTDGKWLEQPVAADQTADGKVPIRAKNAHQGSNAVISIIEWVESDR